MRTKFPGWRIHEPQSNVSESSEFALCIYAGSIVSTANDMARWMNMLLAGGLNKAGEEVFSFDVIQETQSPVNAYSASYGYYPPE